MAQVVIAHRDDRGVQVRPEAVRVRWALEDLVAGDGHALHGVFVCSVRALAAAAERQMLEEVFLGSGSAVTADAVVEHFQVALHSAAGAGAKKKPAGEWIEASNGELVDALKGAAKKVAFACGLEILPPFELSLKSPSLERQRIEQMQRTLAEQRAAGQLEHLQRASELLKQFDSIRQSAPQLSPGEVLRQLSPADQGATLQTLLLAAGKQKATQAVWAVAGPSLLKIDPRRSPMKADVIALPTDLGPLRSVQPFEGGLLAGARSGVLVIDPDNPQEVQCYADPTVTSQLGFSRAVKWHDEIWACHSEAGVVAWKLGQTDKPAIALRPADLAGAAARNLQILDESRLLFSTPDRLMVIERKEAGETMTPLVLQVGSSTSSEIIAGLPQGQQVTVVLKDGRVQLRDRQTLDVVREERPCGPISAAALLPWLGSTRILLATEEGPVLCMSWEDDLVTQYVSIYRGMKSLAAAADLIVALSGDRQRAVIWTTWNARQPAGDVFITALTRHRGADVDL